MKTKATRCAIYVRTAPDWPGPGGVGTSYEEQMRVCRAYVAEQGWQLVMQYSDACSGLRQERPALRTLLEDVGKKFDVVVVSHAMRLARKRSLLMKIAAHVVGAGARLVFTKA